MVTANVEKEPTEPERARAWPRDGVFKVKPAPAGVGGLDDAVCAWFVPSKSEPGAYRLLTMHRSKEGSFFRCSCPAGDRYGDQEPARLAKGSKLCPHIRLALEAERNDGIPPRPTAPPNISALVD